MRLTLKFGVEKGSNINKTLTTFQKGIAYILIGPRGGGALCGHAHAGAFLAAAPVVTLEVIESQFAAVAVLPLDVLLRRKRDTEFMSSLRQEAKRHGAMLLQC